MWLAGCCFPDFGWLMLALAPLAGVSHDMARCAVKLMALPVAYPVGALSVSIP